VSQKLELSFAEGPMRAAVKAAWIERVKGRCADPARPRRDEVEDEGDLVEVLADGRVSRVAIPMAMAVIREALLDGIRRDGTLIQRRLVAAARGIVALACHAPAPAGGVGFTLGDSELSWRLLDDGGEVERSLCESICPFRASSRTRS
jgi:hypothetical protein